MMVSFHQGQLSSFSTGSAGCLQGTHMGILIPITLSLWFSLKEASQHALTPLCVWTEWTLNSKDPQDKHEDGRVSSSIWLFSSVELGAT